jgi:hypothetical protein
MSDKTKKPHTQLEDETTSKRDRIKAKGELQYYIAKMAPPFILYVGTTLPVATS